VDAIQSPKGNKTFLELALKHTC